MFLVQIDRQKKSNLGIKIVQCIQNDVVVNFIIRIAHSALNIEWHNLLSLLYLNGHYNHEK